MFNSFKSKKLENKCCHVHYPVYRILFYIRSLANLLTSCSIFLSWATSTSSSAGIVINLGGPSALWRACNSGSSIWYVCLSWEDIPHALRLKTLTSCAAIATCMLRAILYYFCSLAGIEQNVGGSLADAITSDPILAFHDLGFPTSWLEIISYSIRISHLRNGKPVL